MRRSATILALFAPLLLGLDCKGVATLGRTGSVIRLFANPETVALNGTSAITVSVFEASGQPVSDQTVVLLTTPQGRVEPASVTVIGGFGSTTFFAPNEAGTATIAASSGDAAPASLNIVVGGAATSLTLSASPAELPIGGGTSVLTATVRTAAGLAVPNARISFTANHGSLASSGVSRVSDSNGIATDTLTTSVDTMASASVLGAATVKADALIDVAGTGAATLAVVASPADLPAGGGVSAITATALDSASRPVAGLPIAFRTSAGSLAAIGVVLTDSGGNARNTLNTDRAATVTAKAAGASGSAAITVGMPTVGYVVDLAVSPSFVLQSTAYPTAVAACADPGSFDFTLTATVTFDGAPVAGAQVNFSVNETALEGPDEVGRFCTFPPQITTAASGVAVTAYTLSAIDYAFCDAITTPCGNNVCPPGTMGQTTVNRCCCSLDFSARAQGVTDTVTVPILIHANLGTKPCACIY